MVTENIVRGIETEESTSELRDGLSTAQDEQSDSPASASTRNFGLMGLYQIILRTGWIFKTESIIMPAVLDVIGGPGWLRGCLPTLNRFGQSIPPVLASAHIHSAQQKKLVLASSTMMMGVAFLCLAAIWWFGVISGLVAWWTPYAFLAIYAVFFCSTGINQLTFGTLTGKLIPVARRGKLMLIASFLGTACAITCAALLLPHWLTSDSGNFLAIFSVTGILFILGATVVLMIDEDTDHFEKQTSHPAHLFRSVTRGLSEDENLRRLAAVGALFGISLTLFPHYQALGRQRLDLGLHALVPWVITQNVGVALFSIPAGWLADRFGNRLVLRLLLGIVCVVPVVALLLAQRGAASSNLFWIVFFLIGATPVTIRTTTNYCLELAGREFQPRYLSTLSLCTAGPAIFLSPLVGYLVDQVGFEAMFIAVEVCMLLGWALTFWIVEPRQ